MRREAHSPPQPAAIGDRFDSEARRTRYSRWLEQWEHKLAFRTTNRVVRPFEWGEDWSENWPGREMVSAGAEPGDYTEAWNRVAVERSDDFFRYERPRDFALDGKILRFTSPVTTPHPNNNVATALWFPAENSKGRAIVLVPHWNSHQGQYGTLAAIIRSLGISVLRLGLPYHDGRMPPELQRADFAVSANICRTIDATRQAIIDIRCCYDWLESQGFDRLGLLGISLGSCYGFMASAHDARIATNVFTHCGDSFADIVWTGLSTRHVREGLERGISLERLREVWRVINPTTYVPKFAERPRKKSLLIYCKYDSTVHPKYSRRLICASRAAGIDLASAALPCSHYTMGETPFKYMAGYHMCSFLRRYL